MAEFNESENEAREILSQQAKTFAQSAGKLEIKS